MHGVCLMTWKNVTCSGECGGLRLRMPTDSAWIHTHSIHKCVNCEYFIATKEIVYNIEEVQDGPRTTPRRDK